MSRPAHAVVGAAMLMLGVAAAAVVARAGEVRSTTAIETYTMDGDTPNAIVAYFHAHPFPGDRGPALANIRYSSDLTVDTRESRNACRATSVHVKLDFVITLPTSDETASMSRRTRAMWNELAAFAKAHEYGHRAMDLQCAWNFVARAERVSATDCASVENKVSDMLAASEEACDAAQAGYDRRQSILAANLSLFKAAR